MYYVIFRSTCDEDSKNLLAKIHNLGFIFNEHLTFSDHNISLSEGFYCSITCVNFAVFGLISIPQLPLPLLPLLFTPNLITLILCTINSLSLSYHVSSRSRTVLLVLSLKRLSPVTSFPSCALFTGSESPNASDTSSSHLPTKFSQLSNLHTHLPNLISVQRPLSTRSSSIVTLARPPTSSALKNN